MCPSGEGEYVLMRVNSPVASPFQNLHVEVTGYTV
jgi:hypothetical protein